MTQREKKQHSLDLERMYSQGWEDGRYSILEDAQDDVQKLFRKFSCDLNDLAEKYRKPKEER